MSKAYIRFVHGPMEHQPVRPVPKVECRRVSLPSRQNFRRKNDQDYSISVGKLLNFFYILGAKDDLGAAEKRTSHEFSTSLRFTRFADKLNTKYTKIYSDVLQSRDPRPLCRCELYALRRLALRSSKDNF